MRISSADRCALAVVIGLTLLALLDPRLVLASAARTQLLPAQRPGDMICAPVIAPVRAFCLITPSEGSQR